MCRPLPNVFTKGDHVVLSGENRPFVAVATGTVEEINACDVKILVDRDLCSSPVYSSLVYRIDANNSFTTFSTLLSNLSNLMANTLAALVDLLYRHLLLSNITYFSTI